MPINETLSTYSNWTYGATVAVYVLAMVFYLVEQALTRTAAKERAETPAKVLVAAGTTAAISDAPPESPAPDPTRGTFGALSATKVPHVAHPSRHMGAAEGWVGWRRCTRGDWGREPR